MNCDTHWGKWSMAPHQTIQNIWHFHHPKKDIDTCLNQQSTVEIYRGLGSKTWKTVQGTLTPGQQPTGNCASCSHGCHGYPTHSAWWHSWLDPPFRHHSPSSSIVDKFKVPSRQTMSNLGSLILIHKDRHHKLNYRVSGIQTLRITFFSDWKRSLTWISIWN